MLVERDLVELLRILKELRGVVPVFFAGHEAGVALEIGEARPSALEHLQVRELDLLGRDLPMPGGAGRRQVSRHGSERPLDRLDLLCAHSRVVVGAPQDRAVVLQLRLLSGAAGAAALTLAGALAALAPAVVVPVPGLRKGAQRRRERALTEGDAQKPPPLPRPAPVVLRSLASDPPGLRLAERRSPPRPRGPEERPLEPGAA